MKYIFIFIFTLSSYSLYANEDALQNWAPKEDLSFVYLTWQNEDTSNHMTINYHSSLKYETAQVLFSRKPKLGDVAKYEFRTYGESKRLDNLERAFHRITLQNLEPDSTYYFVVGDMLTGFSKEYSFKTLPDDDSPITFITGGDMGYKSDVADFLRVAAKNNPDFVALGGDIAYANGKLNNYGRWDKWLSMWTQNMFTTDGRLIPMVVAVGNHEVNIFKSRPLGKAPYYYTLFHQGDNFDSYFYKKFGTNMIMYILDTGHISSFGGVQKSWMEESMATHQDIKNQFALYHIPLYPSNRRYNGIQSKIGRSNWLDIFDKYKLDLAFENHDHTFKVSHPLKLDEITTANEGTVYIGDGCWGKTPREAHPERWYLRTAKSKAHVWKITSSSEGYTYEAIDENNNVFFKDQK